MRVLLGIVVWDGIYGLVRFYSTSGAGSARWDWVIVSLIFRELTLSLIKRNMSARGGSWDMVIKRKWAVGIILSENEQVGGQSYLGFRLLA